MQVPHFPLRRSLISALGLLCLTGTGRAAEDFGTLIFEDGFERTESQELKDEPVNEWTMASEKTAAGNKPKSFPHALATNAWHQVHVTVLGDELTCSIDGQPVGTFQSAGFAHATKKRLRLLVPRNVFIDDVNIWRLR